MLDESISRQKVMAYANKHDIEIDIEVDPVWGGVHVHAYAPRDYVFYGSTCRNAGCGDYDSKKNIHWPSVWGEIQLQYDPEAWADEAEGEEE